MHTPRKLRSVAAGRVLLKDMVRDELRDAILDGTFAPGEVLRDAELLEWLEVSRTPLREAINELARIGLIETWPNRFTRVATREASRVAPSMEMLAVLNGGAVLLAVPKLTPESARELQTSSARLADTVRARDGQTARDAFVDLFRRYATHTGNDIYRDRMLDDVEALYFQAPIDAIVSTLDDRGIASVVEAIAILEEAVAERDEQEARRAAEEMHLRLLAHSAATILS